jgi:uncharacterized protein (DUF488 family)
LADISFWELMEKKPVIYTVGHSSRPLNEFLTLLRVHGVQRLIDIRTIPRSRHNPQFNRETLPRFLRNRSIGYRYMKSLGGLRRPRPDSPNRGWRNPSFRGFADYMQTPQFFAALERLAALAAERKTAIMCAEAVPWRCHRSLVADALTIRGFTVKHLYTSARAREHTLSPMARVLGSTIVYPE